MLNKETLIESFKTVINNKLTQLVEREYATVETMTVDEIKSFLDSKKIDEIYGVVDANNIASIRVLENTGFKKVYEGIARYHHQDKQIVKYIYKEEK